MQEVSDLARRVNLYMRVSEPVDFERCIGSINVDKYVL